jgi:hypothetical protein
MQRDSFLAFGAQNLNFVMLLLLYLMHVGQDCNRKFL